ncbi:MAG: low molecular weight phosphatase family protein [Planctomycetota bacterium]
MDKVLFACIRNAGRSQIAAAFFNAAVDPRRARAICAGVDPASRVHPVVVDVMREVGIELGRVKPRRIEVEVLTGLKLIVTMGCGEACVDAREVRRLEWPLPDPKGQPIEKVRLIREEIRERVWSLVAEQGWGRP